MNIPQAILLPPYLRERLADDGRGAAKRNRAADLIERGLPLVLANPDLLRPMRVKRLTKVKDQVWVQARIDLPGALVNRIEADAEELNVPKNVLVAAAIEAALFA